MTLTIAKRRLEGFPRGLEIPLFQKQENGLSSYAIKPDFKFYNFDQERDEPKARLHQPAPQRHTLPLSDPLFPSLFSICLREGWKENTGWDQKWRGAGEDGDGLTLCDETTTDTSDSSIFLSIPTFVFISIIASLPLPAGFFIFTPLLQFTIYIYIIIVCHLHFELLINFLSIPLYFWFVA